MTEPSRPRPTRPRRRKPSALPVAAGSTATFFALFGFMAYQLRTGHDPALGNKAAQITAATPQRVVVKRIEHHLVITKLLPPRGEGDDSGGAQVAVVPTPTQGGPVVVQSAPAPTTAAPASPPVVTKTS
jgi:hypothetical protein